MTTFIKKLTRDDWEIYKELRLLMLSEEPQAYSQSYDEVRKRSDEEWREKTASDSMAILVVFVEGKVAGMGGLFYENTKVAVIWGVFVKKEFRGHGLGKMLMQEIEKEIPENKAIKKVQVYVTSSQITAFELYKKLGYKEVKREYEKKRSDGTTYEEILLEKELLL